MIIDRYIVKQFIPVFIFSSIMFVTLLCLIDLFLNLVHYLNYEAEFSEIMRASIYYIPKSFSLALPIALLFASAYTLGDLSARNELTSIITSGIPFWRLSLSLMVIGLLASVFAFFFEDYAVIPTFKEKNIITRRLRNQKQPEQNSDIVVKTRDGNRIYSVDYYDTGNQTLNGVSIVERDDNGNFILQIRATTARWNGEFWAFNNAYIYEWENRLLRVHNLPPVTDYTESPDIFSRNSVDAADLSAHDAALLVKDLQQAGLPYISAQADYYHRFSFSAVSFIVIILSISTGGRFRKNIMLMSLLTSLSVSVVFYIMEMLSMMMAKLGYIKPLMGAWFPVAFFSLLGLMLVVHAKT
ncbi:MAG: LptF/LptG family permease [Spirochaetaceae bacterium]|nr:LptF/LptG family permease [Spirochaetaceae bacterium]